MHSRIFFYGLIVLMLAISGYALVRLTHRDDYSVTHIDRDGEKPGSKASNLRFSSSIGGGSVWTDPRLKDVKIREGELKTAAEVENNIKVLTDLYDQGADADFLERLKSLIAQNSDVKEYAALLGDFYYNEGNWVEAEKAVRRLVELDPQNNFAKTSLAEILAVQGHYQDGQRINEQVLEHDPRNLDAMYGILSITDLQGRGELGVKVLEDLNKKDPSNGNVAAVLADSLLARGKSSDALKMAEATLKLDANNPLLLRTAAKLAATHGEYGKTVDFAEAAADRYSSKEEKIEALNLAWRASLERKDIDRAERNLQKIVLLDKDNEMARQGLEIAQAMRKSDRKTE